MNAKHEWTFDLPWHMVDLKDWFYMVNTGYIHPTYFLHVRILGLRSLWMIELPDGAGELGELVEAAEKVYQLRYVIHADGPSALIVALAMIDLHKATEKVRYPVGEASKPPDVGN